MMMMPKKASATMIVSKMMGHGKDEGSKDPMDLFSLKDAIHRGDEDEGEDDDMMLESIMEEFIKAVAKKDAKAAVEALKQFIYSCDDEDEDDDEDEEHSEDHDGEDEEEYK